MKIGINAQTLTNPTFNGINTYLSNLLIEFNKIDKINTYYLFSSAPLKYEKLGNNFYDKMGAKKGTFSHLGFTPLFQQHNCDVAFIPKETVPLFIKKPVIITVYDLFFIKLYKRFRKQIAFSSKIHYELARIYSFKKAAKICAISESCKHDLVEYCGINSEKIVTTYLGYNPACFYPRTQWEIVETKKKYTISENYIINISSLFWEPKNVMGVLRAYKRFQASDYPHQLIMIGKKGASYDEMIAFIDRYRLNVKCLFSVPVNDLAILLTGASMLVYPSFHEGFGLPIIEAMAVGCPVITSDCTAMPEIASNAALLVDPSSDEAIFEAMKKAIEDKELAKDLSRKGLSRACDFTWEKTACKTLEVIQAFS